MVLTLIYDMDQTIKKIQDADSILRVASRSQMEILKNPGYYDSLKFNCMPAMLLATTNFSKITENIFSSNFETFSTIGNVNFVNDVATFYQYRNSYETQVIDELKEEVKDNKILLSFEEFLNIDFPSLFFDNSIWLSALSSCRNNCVKMMKLTEEEIQEFSKQREVAESEDNSDTNFEELMQEMYEAQDLLKEARAKYKK